MVVRVSVFTLTPVTYDVDINILTRTRTACRTLVIWAAARRCFRYWAQHPERHRNRCRSSHRGGFSNNLMGHHHHRSPHTQQPRSIRWVGHSQLNQLEHIHPRRTPTCCCCSAKYRLHPSDPYPGTGTGTGNACTSSFTGSPTFGSLPPLKNVGHLLQSSGRNVGSFPINKRKTVASSSWTCWLCESMNWMLHAIVGCVPIYACSSSLDGSRSMKNRRGHWRQRLGHLISSALDACIKAYRSKHQPVLGMSTCRLFKFLSIYIVLIDSIISDFIWSHDFYA